MKTWFFYQQMSLNMNEEEQSSNTVAVERQEISQMVKCRMASLGLPLEDYGNRNFHLRRESQFVSIIDL